jgi:hypothetical protein
VLQWKLKCNFIFIFGEKEETEPYKVIYVPASYFPTGWDTDQFLTDVAEATLIMSSVVKNVSGMIVYISPAYCPACFGIFQETQQ